MTCIYFRRAAVVAAIISHTHTHTAKLRGKKYLKKDWKKNPKKMCVNIEMIKGTARIGDGIQWILNRIINQTDASRYWNLGR